MQDICPADAQEHLLIGTTDAVASALVFDALNHDGPAVEKRIDPAVCSEPFMPGYDPGTGTGPLAGAVAVVADRLALAPHTPAEPRLRCYVTASCRN